MTKYNTMDHARWVESNSKIKCSDLGRRVAYIIGVAFGGIYNAPINHDRVDWDASNGIVVRLDRGRDLASFDHQSLTTLVLICHELCIRVSVKPSMMTLVLTFWQRNPAGTGFSDRHPSIDEAVAHFREWFTPFARELATGEKVAAAEAWAGPDTREALERVEAGE